MFGPASFLIMARKAIPITPQQLEVTQRIALYRRVSSPGQVEKDLSLPEQASQQRAYVLRTGGIITHDFEDAAISGKEVRIRPDFLAMIEAAKAKEFDVLLIHKSDRSFRNRFEAVTTKVMLRNLGIKLKSVVEPWFGGEDPEDQLLEGVMECVAEWYIGNLSREAKKGIRSAANNQGRQQGSPPFGYRWKEPGTPRAGWSVCEESAPWVRRAFESIASGALIPDVCREFNTLRIPTGRARQGIRTAASGWHRGSMQVLLRNEAYIGIVKYNDETFPGAHEPVIDRELFDSVQRTLNRRAKGRAEGSGGIFSGGLLTCPHCQGILLHAPYTDRKGRYIHRYRCARKQYAYKAKQVGLETSQGHGDYGINEHVVMRAIVAGLVEIAGGEENLPQYADYESLQGAMLKRTHEEGYQARIEAAQRELGMHPAVQERLLWQAEFISEEKFKEQMRALEARACDLRSIIESVEQERRQDAYLSPNEAAHLAVLLVSTDYSIQQKRDALRVFTKSITPSADHLGVEIAFRASL